MGVDPGGVGGLDAGEEPGFRRVDERHGSGADDHVPGASLTFPLGIDNRGHVVGMYRDANQVARGLLFEDGAIKVAE